jgi:hypothetical protein
MSKISILLLILSFYCISNAENLKVRDSIVLDESHHVLTGVYKAAVKHNSLFVINSMQNLLSEYSLLDGSQKNSLHTYPSMNTDFINSSHDKTQLKTDGLSNPQATMLGLDTNKLKTTIHNFEVLPNKEIVLAATTRAYFIDKTLAFSDSINKFKALSLDNHACVLKCDSNYKVISNQIVESRNSIFPMALISGVMDSGYLFVSYDFNNQTKDSIPMINLYDENLYHKRILRYVPDYIKNSLGPGFLMSGCIVKYQNDFYFAAAFDWCIHSLFNDKVIKIQGIPKTNEETTLDIINKKASGVDPSSLSFKVESNIKNIEQFRDKLFVYIKTREHDYIQTYNEDGTIFWNIPLDDSCGKVVWACTDSIQNVIYLITQKDEKYYAYACEIIP